MKLRFIFSLALLGLLSTAFGVEMSDYYRHLVITANCSSLSETPLEGFPVLVRLSPSIGGFSYSDFQQSNGADLLFTDADGNPLPHEIDTWDPTGESLVWVRVPFLANGTSIHAYFGGPANPVASATTWQDYAGVWHFAEASGTAFDSTEHQLHGTPSGSAAASMVATAGVIGSARTNSGNKSYLSIPNYDFLHLGSNFTMSAWFKATTMSGYPRYFSRKQTYTEAHGWEIEAKNGSKTAATARGANNKTVEATFPDITANWVYLTLVYNNDTLSLYVNGKLSRSGAINPATDNGYPLSIGSDSDGSETAFNGRFDEARLRGGYLSAEWIAAEYATATDPAFLVYDDVVYANPESPFLAADSSLALHNGVWTLSADLISGIGSVYAIYNGSITNLVAANTTGPASLTETPANLPADSVITWEIYAKHPTSELSHSRAGSGFVLNGAVSIAAGANADEATFAAGSFIVSRPNTASATSVDLVVPYTVAGPAVNGRSFETLSGSITIPAGSDSATIPITPLYDILLQEDATVTLTLTPSSSYFLGNASASITLVDDPTALTDPTIRFVSTEGSDNNNGLTIDTAFATLPTAIDSLGLAGGRVYILPGAYPQNAEIGLTNAPIAIIGMSGDPEDVLLYRNSSAGNFRLFTLNHEEALLQHLTVSNGFNRVQGSHGGNIMIDSLGGTIDHCTLIHGRANELWAQKGGNLYMKAGLVTRCILTGGLASSNREGGGGNVYMTGGILENSLITQGRCDGTLPAGVFLSGPSILRNCTITHNTSKDFAAVYLNSASSSIVNCLITGNTATTPSFEGSSVYGPSASYADNFRNCLTDVELNSSCIVGGVGFVDELNQNYHLSPASYAIDAGKTIELSRSLDLDGNPRVSGGAIDIGCYEVDLSSFNIGVSCEVTEGLIPFTTSFTAGAVSAAGPVTYTWDFGDGSDPVSTTTPTVEHTYLNPGSYSVSVTGSDGTSTSSMAIDAFITTYPRLLYASSKNPNAEYPYATEETGAATLNDALDSAYDGTTIILLPGTFDIAKTPTISRDVTILGQTGNPEDVILYRTDGNNNRTLNFNASGVFLGNVTLTNGFAGYTASPNRDRAGSIFMDANGGTVSNCVIRNSTADNYYGSGGGIYAEAGLITHCIFTKCQVTRATETPSLAVFLGTNARMENCLLYDNHAPASQVNPAPVVRSSGIIRNCTIVQSTVTTNAAGLLASSGIVENTVIAGITTTEGDPVTWDGSASRYSNCATDGAEPINETCIIGTPATFFTDYASRNFTVFSESLLLDHGKTYEGMPTIDLAGNARIIGILPEIGCYELPFSPATLIFVR